MNKNSTLHRLISGGGLRAISLTLSIIIAFLMMPFVVKHLGERWYGLWVIVGSLIGYYGVLDFGLSSACQRFIAKALHNDKDGEINTIVSSSFLLFSALSIFSILITCFVLWLSPMFFPVGEELRTFQVVISILGIKTAIMFLFMVFNGIISAHLRYDIDSYIEIFKLALRTTLIFLYLTMGYSIVALAVITLLTETLGYILIAISAKKVYTPLRISVKNIDPSLFKKLLNYSKSTFIASLGDILRFRIDDLVIAKFIGLAAVTHYSIAIQLVNYIGQFLNTLLGGFLPVFTKYVAQNNNDTMKEKFLLVSEISIFLTLLIVPTVMIIGESFIKIWMGEQFVDAYIPLLILGFAAILAGCNRVCITVLYAKAKHHYFAKVNILEGIANLVLSIVLVREYGIIGVAIGTAIPTILVKTYLLPKYSCELLEINLNEYYKLLGKYFIVTLLFYSTFFWFYQSNIKDTYIHIVFLAAISCFLYLLVAFFLLFSDNLKFYIKQLIPKRYLPFFRKII
ncbi:oligosaccharide flippase family protein [Colwellia sp. KU-HH00111]|uniref:oligosaccharide flippase family protein n=1 Tax=Colwellia sp. KU-HH00111 TaxID=3127652 RepID=UPI0033657738